MKLSEIRYRTVWLVRSGSRLYGTATPTSDFDYKGICIPPLGCGIGLDSGFESCDDVKLMQEYGLDHVKSDITIFSLQKACRLIADGNPNTIEILFAPEEKEWRTFDYFPQTQLFKKTILANRHSFLSKRIYQRFLGFALSAFSKVKKHQQWLISPPEKKPERADYGLPPEQRFGSDEIFEPALARFKQEICEILKDDEDLAENVKQSLSGLCLKLLRKIWTEINEPYEIPYPIGKYEEIVDVDCAAMMSEARNLGYSNELIDLLRRERKYRSDKQEWDHYQQWLKESKNSNLELEKQLGYRPKDAYHVVRLMRMAEEILRDGQVLVCRPDWEELVSIRNGAWSYEQLEEFVAKQKNVLELCYKESKLPNHPPMKEISKMVVDLTLEYNRRFEYESKTLA